MFGESSQKKNWKFSSNFWLFSYTFDPPRARVLILDRRDLFFLCYLNDLSWSILSVRYDSHSQLIYALFYILYVSWIVGLCVAVICLRRLSFWDTLAHSSSWLILLNNVLQLHDKCVKKVEHMCVKTWTTYYFNSAARNTRFKSIFGLLWNCHIENHLA